MTLTVPEVKNALPKSKDYKLYDQKGLYVLVTTKASKYWRMKYRFGGKEKVFSIGVFPEVSLKQAREIRDKTRVTLADGIDPNQLKKTQKMEREASTQNSFEATAKGWYQREIDRGLSSTTLKKKLWLLEKKVFPSIGSLPLEAITPPLVLNCIKKMEAKKHYETANRAMQVISQVFRYAVAHGLVQADPTRDLRGALTPAKTKHFAAITDPTDFGKLIRDIDQYSGTAIVRGLLRLSPLIFQRPGEARKMEWREIDFERSLWLLPEHKMKPGVPHTVPLSKQALDVIFEMKPISLHRSPYVFPALGNAKAPASEAAVTKALRRMGYGREIMTAHGFRTSARTILDEVLGYAPHIIEQQLSHAVRDPLGRAYNRTVHLEQRRVMVQHWADYLDELKAKD